MSYDSYSNRTTETRLSLPFNGRIYTTQRSISTEKPTPVIGATMESELGPKWADSRIIAVNKVPNSTTDQLSIVHARIPAEADQLATNWGYSTCSMGGQQFPAVTRTVILLASTVAHDTPAKGSAMPVEPGSIFTGQGYILQDRQVVRSGMQLEPVFRVEQRSYVKRSTIKQLGIDPLNGKTLTSQNDLYYASEVITGGVTMATLANSPNDAYWGIQTNGTQRTFSQLSCEWYSVTTSQIVSGTFAEGIVDLGSHTSNDPYYWPPVLAEYEVMDWVRIDGGVDLYPRLTFNPDGYNGPCHTTIARSWSRTPQSIPVVIQMKPTRIYYASPYYTVNIPECLHGAVTFHCDTGSGDPIYEVNAGSGRTTAATNYTTWPDTIVAYDDQEPFRGGYLRTRRTVTKPA